MAATVIGFVSAVVVIATALPLIRTHAGIVRICDFPRPQILAVGIAVLLAIVFYLGWEGWAPLVLGLPVAAACIAQAVRIAPYTPVFPKESTAPRAVAPERCVTLLIANVLQQNRDARRLVELIQSCDPDIVFAVETDQWWCDELEPVARRYPHATILPQENEYGVVFCSRLPVVSCEVRRLVKQEVPSVKACLRLASGEIFWFHGLHPEPPGPIQDVEDRDTELIIVARDIRDQGEPAVVAGDLNDVAWSRTNNLFQRVSGTLDPRVGRSLFATFHARYWFARWPLDHLFYTSDFAIQELRVMPYVGSDHFPVLGRLCFFGDRREHD